MTEQVVEQVCAESREDNWYQLNTFKPSPVA